MKKKILGVVAIVVVIAALLGVYYAFREKPENPNMGPGENGHIEFVGKNISIELVGKDGENTEFLLTTTADYLKEAMDEAEGLEYETADGMVMVINGVRADYVKDGAYWAFFVNGEYCNRGISDQPVNDGDAFSIVYTKA